MDETPVAPVKELTAAFSDRAARHVPNYHLVGSGRRPLSVNPSMVKSAGVTVAEVRLPLKVQALAAANFPFVTTPAGMVAIVPDVVTSPIRAGNLVGSNVPDRLIVSLDDGEQSRKNCSRYHRYSAMSASHRTAH
jgi:hypothetical protein